MKETTDIFMVTFRRDLPFFKYCLKAIQKFVSGFEKLQVLVPFPDVTLFVAAANGDSRVVVQGFQEAAGKGMLHHMAIVCTADRYSDADFFLHLDTDCIFKESVNIRNEYFFTDKPVLCYAPFDKLPDEVRPWQKAVEAALGFKPDHETMRRHPAVHPRWIYQKVRRAIADHTQKDFLEYVLSCKNSFPQTFAEYPTLGAWAMQFNPEYYHWINTSEVAAPPDRMVQLWSHGGLGHKYISGPFAGKTAQQVIDGIIR